MVGIAERLLYNACTVTYAPTPLMAMELRRRGFEGIHLSGRGVGTALFRPHRPGSIAARGRWPAGTGLRVLCVSRLAREKGLDALARVAAEHPGFRLLLVGTGPMAEELTRSAPPNLRLTRLLEGEALADVYSAAEVFLRPSATETFGQVVQEAMASGLPVVGLRAGGVAWLVEDSVSGLLVYPPGEGLGGALVALSEARERRAMGRAARRAVSGHTWRAILDSLLEDYARLAAEGCFGVAA
ncbi:MAG: glycosyltransferase [Candidatus Dormiibacterota bacterium]